VPEDHYFSAAPASPDERREVEAVLGGREVTVQTATGVFSGHRVDLGTQVLLRSVPAPPASGDLLDLGCGWGPLALSMAVLSPAATVWAVDVNERALDLVRRNAAGLGLHGVRAVRPEQVPPELRLAAIWSNPPIRVGKSALHDLLATWLRRLDDGSAAHLVVQRNLGADSLLAWLRAQAAAQALGPRMDVRKAASAKGFRVLVAERAPAGADVSSATRAGGADPRDAG
jgi:16S rRNA G1207 methylase RsmC